MGSSLRVKILVCYELVQTTKEYMIRCMPSKSKWLHEATPDFHKEGSGSTGGYEDAKRWTIVHEGVQILYQFSSIVADDKQASTVIGLECDSFFVYAYLRNEMRE